MLKQSAIIINAPVIFVANVNKVQSPKFGAHF